MSCTVIEADNLSVISQRLGISVDDIRKQINLFSDSLREGQALQINHTVSEESKPL